ncbi:hypothetical protein CPU12_09910 [Malaciobacter molluscorum LMG 25693]|uniref:Two-component system response regulator n=1 Tax=Malaciobacter molluscorum LMG 25693 TaxID=870501 RepID=A0A2G1DGI8_9BACT|nr:response regulator [Malaciobacter molluscorum]AXX91518.1 two-component system response regulator [Malaciobacter molluscorum LMG 25693]PHO17603.1 hypothetical protein CPU12_09910 [Malaciobacter molluscorum LMG 25693]
MLDITNEKFNDITVLYVEDDLMTSEEITYFLSKYVKKVIIAKDGEEGLKLFKEHSIDIVITDIQMPKMNGLDMSEKILDISPSVPIVLTTAFTEASYLVRAIELGIDKYLLKPVNLNEILAIIKKSLYIKNLEDDQIIYEDYIQFILDNNSTFMFIMNSSNIEYVSNQFLEFLGYSDLKSFNNQLNQNESIMQIDELKLGKGWFDYLVQNKDKRHLLKVKKNSSDIFVYQEFYVTYKYFENMHKSILLFVDKNEDKLEKISKITNELIIDLNNNISNNILMKKLKDILEITEGK